MFCLLWGGMLLFVYFEYDVCVCSCILCVGFYDNNVMKLVY